MKTPQIYVSYAWADKNDPTREQIVDEIEQALQRDGYTLIRDKTNGVGYGKSIEAFMQAIGQGDWVLVVLSQKSLQSVFCMYEVTEIMRDRNFAKRVLPVILPDANIFDRDVRDQIVDFWADKVNEQQAYLERRGTRALPLDRELLERYKLIALKLGDFIATMMDLNSSSPQLLRDNNFKDIIDYLRSKRDAQAPTAQPNPAGQPPAPVSGELKEQVRQLIAKDKLKEVFKLLGTAIVDTQKLEAFALVESRFSEANKENMLGLLTHAEFAKLMARIRFDMLGLLDD
jgi:TIR domain/Effector-associated domain 11